ncbi:hypothetical protein ACQY1H_06705 [Agrobacterium vitis]|uniref:hypothetical protein n=1 Tax=Agrobacterium vitis TaxID=373 RepID=UPI003D2D9FB4
MEQRPNYQELKDFGYLFLGPVFSAYLNSYCKKYEFSTPICLAREGWALQRLFQKFTSSHKYKNIEKPVYLKVSRTLLFRAALGEKRHWKFLLSKSYVGTINQLLRNRFGLSEREIANLELDQEIKQIKLPEQANLVIDWLTRNENRLEEITARTRNAVTNYLRANVLPNRKNVFVDIGYSGTIQTLIGILTESETEGYYFITTPVSEVEDTPRIKMEACFLNEAKWNSGQLMLDKSLILECLLTAPHGQIRDIIEKSTGGFEFLYGQHSLSQTYFQDLLAILDGADACVQDAIANETEYSSDEVTAMMNAGLAAPSVIPRNLKYLFKIDDDFSGNGILDAAKFFGI